MTHNPTPIRTLSWPGPRWLGIAVLVLLFLLLTGCDQTGQMIDQAKYTTLKESPLFADKASARLPVAGSVSYQPGDLSPDRPDLTGLDETGQPLKASPVKASKELIQQGQQRFNIYCIPCHGPAGEGNGKATQFNFPKPPSLLADQAKALTDGEIFTIITNGRGKMFPYGYRVQPQERWAVVAYIRAMQLKNGAVTVDQLTPDEINQLGKQP